MFRDVNASWTKSSQPVLLSEINSKLQFVDSYFKLGGDAGFFSNYTFEDISAQVFELIDEDFVSEAVDVIKLNLEALNIGIYVDEDLSYCKTNYSSEYEIYLELTIEGTQVPFNRRYVND